MAINESARHELFNHFKELLGTKDTGTLMELLPPVGWADVATKHDLAALEERIDLRFSGLEERSDMRFSSLEERIDSRCDILEHRLMSAFRGELNSAIHSQTKVFVMTLMGTLLAYSGGISALVLTR